MILCEFRQVLVNVEYDRYRDDKENGIDISTYKLLYDVPIEALDVSENESLRATHAMPRLSHCVWRDSHAMSLCNHTGCLLSHLSMRYLRGCLRSDLISAIFLCFVNPLVYACYIPYYI